MALSDWEEIMKCSEGVNEMSGLGGGGGEAKGLVIINAWDQGGRNLNGA